ncbi:MAG TPA: FixH family protein [Thiobacillus sp.]|nr:FixH family protein [Thiobacillus sp.]
MTTMMTLFGGLLAVLVLYATIGLLRSVPPMLRAVLAAIIPLMAYFGLTIGRWPGLDVIAMHISVFSATALVLYALTEFRRRGGKKMHWAPKLLVAFFIGLAFLNAALLQIATKGLPEPIAEWWLGSQGGAVYSGFSGVVPHGQNAAKAVSSELSETHRESQLGWQVEVSGLDGLGKANLIQVRVKDRTGLPVERVAAEVRLLRAGVAEPELILALDSVESGVYAGVLTLPATGRWLVEMRLMQDGKLHYHQIQELTEP